MQLVQVKRLGPGKFYLSHKGDRAFIKGNLSSHKGWMSWFFFVKRVGKKRDPWGCDMSWRDNMYTLTPSTPERSPNLASFLDAMRDKSYNSPELIKEYLLCLFRFSRKGVELAGNLDERMGKAAMLKAWEEAEEDSSRAALPARKVAKKWKASTPAEKEAWRQRKKKGASTSAARPAPTTEERRASTPPIPTTEKLLAPTHVTTIPEVSSPERGPTKETGPGRVSALNFFEDSLVVSHSGVVATRFLCHMASDRDISRLGGATDSEANGYSEEEHPTSFLNVRRTLEELPDDEEEDEEEEEEEGDAEATPLSSPKPSLYLAFPLHCGVATRGVANAELGLGAELVGLMHSRRRATRGDANAELGSRIIQQSGVATRGVANAELDLSVELVGLMCSDGVAIRGVTNAELGLSAELVGLMHSRRRATRGGANVELDLSAELVGLMCSGGVATRGGLIEGSMN
ncbi:hypothetical protein F511_30261 [Dorcoceras hygrometricum]|uniref:Uncharacterized protein n=1 Tax=Dorcoceras hygrometricum TaxID=472368 RepID=A0A2Z7CDU7_9LAMI|nr:hypothetical protein F511_30261 [Dorcoceras hygrometricum]